MSKKIQIVEDEAIAAMLLKIHLEEWQCTCLEPVASGAEAVELARKELPDIILMDINLMGTMDGIEAAEKILDFSNPSIIFLTGFDDANIRKRAEALNPFAYLTKPYDSKHLEQLIKEL